MLIPLILDNAVIAAVFPLPAFRKHTESPVRNAAILMKQSMVKICQDKLDHCEANIPSRYSRMTAAASRSPSGMSSPYLKVLHCFPLSPSQQ